MSVCTTRDRESRYVCSPPKFPAFELARGIPQLSKRYKNLYIPADFCRMNACWVHSLPDHRPLDLTDDIGFKINKVLSTIPSQNLLPAP